MGMRQTWWERPIEIKWHDWVCKAMLGVAWDESVWVRLNFSELPGGCSEFSVRFLSRFCQGFCFKETSEYFASLPFSVWSPSFITWLSWLCGLKWERSKSKFFLLYFIYFFIIIFIYLFFCKKWLLLLLLLLLLLFFHFFYFLFFIFKKVSWI